MSTKPLSRHIFISSADEHRHLHELLDMASDPAQLDRQHLGRLINAQMPNVQREVHAFLGAMDYTGAAGGRQMPFAPRQTTQDAAALFDVPHDVASNVYQKAVDESLTSALQHRMGTDASLNVGKDEPPTLRDHLAAAFDAHEHDLE